MDGNGVSMYDTMSDMAVGFFSFREVRVNTAKHGMS